MFYEISLPQYQLSLSFNISLSLRLLTARNTLLLLFLLRQAFANDCCLLLSVELNYDDEIVGNCHFVYGKCFAESTLNGTRDGGCYSALFALGCNIKSNFNTPDYYGSGLREMLRVICH